MNKEEIYAYVKKSLADGVALDIIKGTILSEGKGHIADVDEAMMRINNEKNNTPHASTQIADINWLGPKVIHPKNIAMPIEYVAHQEKRERLYFKIMLISMLVLSIGSIVYGYQKNYIRIIPVPLSIEFGQPENN